MYTGQGAKESSAKEPERNSQGDSRKTRTGWEQRGVRASQRKG